LIALGYMEVDVEVYGAFKLIHVVRKVLKGDITVSLR